MNPELFLVFVPALSGMLFALGGTQLSDTISGKKWIRRFVLPFAIYLPAVLIAGFIWWQALLVASISCLFFHLGYGDKSNWTMRALIFTGYGLISIPIGISWWNLITAIGCLIMMWLSRIGLPKLIVWKIVEFSFGVLIGLQLGFLLSGNGIIW